jgi:hypothetical protein
MLTFVYIFYGLLGLAGLIFSVWALWELNKHDATDAHIDMAIRNYNERQKKINKHD